MVPTPTQEDKDKEGPNRPIESSSENAGATMGPSTGAEPSFPFDPGGVKRKEARKSWEWDPTPPHLATPMPQLGPDLPDAPLIVNPVLFEHLTDKAETRWGRSFTMQAQAGRTKQLGKEVRYLNHGLGKRGRGLGEALFIIPAASKLDSTLNTLLSLRQRNVTTSALLLLPENYTVSDDVKTFLHAYCQQGEVYRYGKLFKRTPEGPYMHLNQAFTEYWFDGESAHLANLTPRQRGRLDRLATPGIWGCHR